MFLEFTVYAFSVFSILAEMRVGIGKSGQDCDFSLILNKAHWSIVGLRRNFC